MCTRTTAFSQIRSARQIAQLVFVPAGGALISIDPWVPMIISFVFMILGFVVAAVAVPETLFNSVRGNANGEHEPLLNNHDRIEVSKAGLWSRLHESLSSLTAAAQLVGTNGRLVLLVLCFALFQVGEQAGGTLLLQYVAKRLNWTIGQVSSYLDGLYARTHRPIGILSGLNPSRC